MSRKTRKLMWSVPLIAAVAVIGALAAFMTLTPSGAQADHVDLPGPVTDLAATAKSRTSIELTWEAPASGDDPTGYRIDYSDDNRVWTRLVENTMSTQTSHPITDGVSSTTRRHYRVFAMNSAGTGPISKDPVTAFVSVGDTYPPVAPNAVTLTATPDGPNKINLSWDAAVENGSPVTNYIVEEMLDEDGNAATARTACASNAAVTTGLTSVSNCLFIEAATQMTKRTAESANLLAGTTHYYRVTAVSSHGNSVSNVVGATTTRLTAPAPATGLVAVPVASTIELYWIDPTSTGGHTLADHEIETQTRVSASASWPNTWTSVTWSPGGVADAYNTQLTGVADGQHRYRIRSMQEDLTPAAGYNLRSGWQYSNVATLPVPAVATTTVPLQPTLNAVALDATTVDGEGIRLTWMPSLGTDGERGPQDADNDPQTPAVNDDGPTPSDYRIDRSDDGLSWEVGQTRTVTIGQWEDFIPDATDDGHYRILPLNGNVFGQGAYATATATAANVSAADLLLNLDATGISTTEIRLTWDQPSGAVSYDIQRADLAAGTSGLPATYANIKTGHTGTTYTDSKDLKPGDEKWYRVVAKNKDNAAIAGTGGAEAKGMTLDAGEPAAPVDLVVESAADSSFTATTRRGTLLLWNEPVDNTKDPETAYQVQRKVNDGEWETIMADTMNLSTHFNDEEEPADDEMRVYRVLARSGTGVGMPSNEAHFPADTSHEQIPPPDLTAPDDIVVSPLQNTISVTWDTASIEQAEQIKVVLFDEGVTTIVDIETINAASDDGSHTFTGVDAGTYKVVVASFRTGDPHKLSPLKTVTIQ